MLVGPTRSRAACGPAMPPDDNPLPAFSSCIRGMPPIVEAPGLLEDWTRMRSRARWRIRVQRQVASRGMGPPALRRLFMRPLWLRRQAPALRRFRDSRSISWMNTPRVETIARGLWGARGRRPGSTVGAALHTRPEFKPRPIRAVLHLGARASRSVIPRLPRQTRYLARPDAHPHG